MLNNYVFLNRPLALQTHIVKNKRAILIKQVVLLYNVLKQYFKFKNCSSFFLKSLSFRSRIEKRILHQFFKNRKNTGIISKFRYFHKKRKKKKRGWHVKKLHSHHVLHNIKFLSCLWKSFSFFQKKRKISFKKLTFLRFSFREKKNNFLPNGVQNASLFISNKRFYSSNQSIFKKDILLLKKIKKKNYNGHKNSVFKLQPSKKTYNITQDRLKKKRWTKLRFYRFWWKQKHIYKKKKVYKILNQRFNGHTSFEINSRIAFRHFFYRVHSLRGLKYFAGNNLFLVKRGYPRLEKCIQKFKFKAFKRFFQTRKKKINNVQYPIFFSKSKLLPKQTRTNLRLLVFKRLKRFLRLLKKKKAFNRFGIRSLFKLWAQRRREICLNSFFITKTKRIPKWKNQLALSSTLKNQNKQKKFFLPLKVWQHKKLKTARAAHFSKTPFRRFKLLNTFHRAVDDTPLRFQRLKPTFFNLQTSLLANVGTTRLVYQTPVYRRVGHLFSRLKKTWQFFSLLLIAACQHRNASLIVSTLSVEFRRTQHHYRFLRLFGNFLKYFLSKQIFFINFVIRIIGCFGKGARTRSIFLRPLSKFHIPLFFSKILYPVVFSFKHVLTKRGIYSFAIWFI
jgi:hypothetical protein